MVCGSNASLAWTWSCICVLDSNNGNYQTNICRCQLIHDSSRNLGLFKLDTFLILGVVFFLVEQFPDYWSQANYYINGIVMILAAFIVRQYAKQQKAEHHTFSSWRAQNVYILFLLTLFNGANFAFLCYNMIADHLDFLDVVGPILFFSYVVSAFLLFGEIVKSQVKRFFSSWK